MAADITSDLELWYKGDGSGSTLTDYSGGSIGDGTLNNNTSLVTGITDHPNGLQNAVAKTASNGDVTSTGNFAIPETSDLTIAWWQKMTGAGNLYNINTHDGTDYSFTIFQANATTIQILPGSGNTNADPWIVDNLTDNGWHHYAVIFDATGENCYLWQDGVHTDTDSTVPIVAAWATNNPLMLFERGGANLSMNAQMCDIRIYSRALASDSDPDLNIAALFAYTDSVEDDSQQDLIP